MSRAKYRLFMGVSHSRLFREESSAISEYYRNPADGIGMRNHVGALLVILQGEKNAQSFVVRYKVPEVRTTNVSLFHASMYERVDKGRMKKFRWIIRVPC